MQQRRGRAYTAPYVKEEINVSSIVAIWSHCVLRSSWSHCYCEANPAQARPVPETHHTLRPLVSLSQLATALNETIDHTTPAARVTITQQREVLAHAAISI